MILAKSNGFKMEEIIKTNVFLTDMAHFKEVNKAYAEFFKNDPPARSCMAVRSLPIGALIEIDATFF